MVQQVAEALHYLHKNGVLHRDVTLGNILRTADGCYKVADFGLAVQLNSPASTHLTVCGTPNSISPEVVAKNPYR